MQTALNHAVFHNKLEVVEVLLSNGVPVDKVTHYIDQSLAPYFTGVALIRPIMMAVLMSHVQAALLLLGHNAWIDVNDPAMLHALVAVGKQGYKGCVALLLKNMNGNLERLIAASPARKMDHYSQKGGNC